MLVVSSCLGGHDQPVVPHLRLDPSRDAGLSSLGEATCGLPHSTLTWHGDPGRHISLLGLL